MGLELRSKIKKALESWFLSDNLGSDNFANGNITNESFIESFGIEEICLIEMYDDENGVYFTPSIIGKVFSFSVDKVTGEFVEELAKLLNHVVPVGFSIQILSYIRNLGIEHQDFVISISRIGKLEEEDAIEELVVACKSVMESLELIVSTIDEVNPSHLLNYMNKIFFAEEQFTNIVCPYYSEEVLFREQLIKSENKVKVICDSKGLFFENLETGKKYSTNVFGVKQYPIIPNYEDLSTEFFNDIVSGYSEDEILSKNLIVIGIYKPKTKNTEKPTVKDFMNNKIAIYSFMVSFSEDRKDIISAENIDKLKKRMGYIEYEYAILKNKQLGALSTCLPLHFNENTVSDIESLKCLHRVDKINSLDLLPMFIKLSANKDNKKNGL